MSSRRLFLGPSVLALLLSLAGCENRRPATAPPSALETMTEIPGGRFLMGSDEGFPAEAPVHEVKLSPFRIDRREVTVAEFERFVAKTAYQTEAERFGWSGVFDATSGGWAPVDGANWRFPDGPSQPAARAEEPVTQISWNDAVVYCAARGRRLPTEAEFELAARGGLVGKRYAWGDELEPGGAFFANYWQGFFPRENLAQDGFSGRAPVASFPANGYGLFDMTGNVWEWTADWYDPGFYVASPKRDPRGPPRGTVRSIRGGSFLCSENYCVGYRVAARSQATPDSGLDNLGFRCAG